MRLTAMPYPDDFLDGPVTAYLRCGAVAAVVIFCLALVYFWRAAVRSWGMGGGLIVGFLPAVLGAAVLAFVGFWTWPAWLLAPLAVIASRGQARGAHGERAAPRPR